MIKSIVAAIRRRMLTVMGVLLLVSLVALTILSLIAARQLYSDWRQDAYRAASGDMQDTVARVDLALFRFYSMLDLFSVAIEHARAKGDMDIARVFEINNLANIRRNRTVVGFYGLVDGKFFGGDRFGDCVPWIPPEDYDPQSRPWYRAACRGKGDIACSDPYVDLDTGITVFSFSRLLSDGKSVVAVDITVNCVVEALRRRRNAAYGETIVFSVDGKVVSTDCENTYDKREMESFCRRIISSGAMPGALSGSFPAERADGRKVIVFFGRSSFGLRVVTVFDEDEYRQAYDRPIRPILAMADICAVLFIVTALLIIVRLRRLNFDLNRRNRELICAQKAKSMFFSMVSHDLRTPLNSIIGFSDILRLGVESNEERQEAAQAIYESGQSMYRMVSDILDVARIDRGELAVDPVECDIRQTVEGIRRMLLVRQEPDGAPYLTIDADPVPMVMFDPNRLRQILCNLVDNAFKFAPTGSEISLRVRWHGAAGADTGRLYFEVEDRGPGIPEKDCQRIFEPFEQVCDNNHRGAGVGLGLTICKRLVERMGGAIALRSTVGVGSVFSLDFPSVEIVRQESPRGESHVPAPSAASSAAPSAPVRRDAVLIVDDLPANVRVLNVFLKRLGVEETVAAADGVDALRILDAAPDGAFKAVLTDLWMPHLDGYGLLQEIRKRPRFADLRVFAITADCEAGATYPMDGFAGVLFKPLNEAKLKALLEAGGCVP